MRRRMLFRAGAVSAALALVVTFALLAGGCSRQTRGEGGGSDGGVDARDVLPPDATRTEWSYERAPTPAIDGSPDFRLLVVGFSSGSSELPAGAEEALRSALADLENPEGRRYAVVGFADVQEDDEQTRVGIRRAQALREALVTLGVPGDAIHISSFGPRMAAARDYETLKQARDRRAEIWVLL